MDIMSQLTNPLGRQNVNENINLIFQSMQMHWNVQMG